MHQTYVDQMYECNQIMQHLACAAIHSRQKFPTHAQCSVRPCEYKARDGLGDPSPLRMLPCPVPECPASRSQQHQIPPCPLFDGPACSKQGSVFLQRKLLAHSAQFGASQIRLQAKRRTTMCTGLTDR